MATPPPALWMPSSPPRVDRPTLPVQHVPIRLRSVRHAVKPRRRMLSPTAMTGQRIKVAAPAQQPPGSRIQRKTVADQQHLDRLHCRCHECFPAFRETDDTTRSTTPVSVVRPPISKNVPSEPREVQRPSEFTKGGRPVSRVTGHDPVRARQLHQATARAKRGDTITPPSDFV